MHAPCGPITLLRFPGIINGILRRASDVRPICPSLAWLWYLMHKPGLRRFALQGFLWISGANILSLGLAVLQIYRSVLNFVKGERTPRLPLIDEDADFYFLPQLLRDLSCN